MSLRKRAVILNGSILLVLLVELRFYSGTIVGASALTLLVVANVALLARARREQRKGKG
jgi:hypothetical protein